MFNTKTISHVFYVCYSVSSTQSSAHHHINPTPQRHKNLLVALQQNKLLEVSGRCCKTTEMSWRDCSAAIFDSFKGQAVHQGNNSRRMVTLIVL